MRKMLLAAILADVVLVTAAALVWPEPWYVGLPRAAMIGWLVGLAASRWGR
jgi:hypothetical protein